MSAESDPNRLAVRKIAFEYPADLDPAWNRQFPEFAFAANSVSLLMPYAEPYFVKAVRSALGQIDPTIKSRTEDYLRQELQHHVQHRRFNDLIVARYPRIARVESWMKQTYGWLSRTRSQRFNLAFAAGSETIAFAIARWTESHLGEFFDGADPVAATLFLWHLAEEVEHKTAAFDVYEQVDGSRLRYLAAMTTSFALLAWFTILSTLTMLWADHRLARPTTWFRLFKWSLSLSFTVLPDMLASAMPSHHPSDFSDPPLLSAWLRDFDPVTGTMPVWTPGI
ncbi:MAG: metal-dependent hydrolase [Actinomycetes bacterium]